MSNADEISEFALRLSRDAAKQMTAFLRNESTSRESSDDAFMLLIRQFMEGDETDAAAQFPKLAADLLDIAKSAVFPIEPDPADLIDSRDVYRLVADHRYAEALALADRLVQVAATAGSDGELSEDDWVHHANIIRGKAHLALGDAAASQAALLAAGDVQGSPALKSFGPDLSLAWDLMRAGHDDAVIGYLRRISRFWSPRDAIGVRSDEPTEERRAAARRYLAGLAGERITTAPRAGGMGGPVVAMYSYRRYLYVHGECKGTSTRGNDDQHQASGDHPGCGTTRSRARSR